MAAGVSSDLEFVQGGAAVGVCLPAAQKAEGEPSVSGQVSANKGDHDVPAGREWPPRDLRWQREIVQAIETGGGIVHDRSTEGFGQKVAEIAEKDASACSVFSC
jgi:hypothetical protein